MTKKIALFLIVIVGIFFIVISYQQKKTPTESLKEQKRTWEIKSIDTMKYSRDLTGEKLNDPTFDGTIEGQVKAISQTGATHIAIATPYDQKFIPYIKRWVKAARRNGLNVWFRGNFSGWEGWFGYKKDLTRSEHLALMRQFINQNGDLFENGDLFTPCPECEHGGPGDPRQNGDVEGFRQFMIEEFQAANGEFRTVGKNVRTVTSMNYDVANLIMDEQTANALGDLIVIDHYVDKPQKLADDIRTLSQKAQSKIMLGEFGAPIPDIHGKLNEEQQAQWVDESLNLIQSQEEVIGLNYWVSYGGSTAIFNNDHSPKLAAGIVKKYYTLRALPTP